MKVSYANRLSFLLISAAILTAMLIVTPARYGDGVEYFLMTESLFNHLTPDLQNRDIQTLQNSRRNFTISYYPDNITGYFQAKDGRNYFRHFWVYPLFNLPVKFILHILHLNELKVFQITNSILLILALFHVAFISKFTEPQKMLFCFLAVFCPAFWFIRWTHPEIFSYSLVILSLVYMDRKNWPASVLSAAVASTQNQPLIFWVAYLWTRRMLYSTQKSKDFFVLSLSALPALLPNIFSYAKYGTVNLLFEKVASFSNISIFKALEMFFDLNIGMLPYIPLTLFIFFGVIGREGFLKREVSISVHLFLLLLIMMLLCTATFNWNSGTTGPARHVIWMLPFIFYVVVVKGPFRPALLGAAMVMQGLIVFAGGGFTPEENYLRHSPLARFTLNHFPAVYNPSPEIFIERTLNLEGPPGAAARYYYNGQCRKALVKEDGNPVYINY